MIFEIVNPSDACTLKADDIGRQAPLLAQRLTQKEGD